MIVGLGVDVVELDRIEKALERHGERFLERILTTAERVLMSKRPKSPVPFLAARFAAKEAAAKALGVGFRNGLSHREIEVTNGAQGEPSMHFSGAAEARAEALGVVRARVSLTHGQDVAVAVVVLETLAS